MRSEKSSVDRIRIKVLDPLTFRFSHDDASNQCFDSDYRNITKEKAAAAKLAMAVEALKEEAAPWKASTEAEADVLLVALGKLVSPASAACCEVEA